MPVVVYSPEHASWVRYERPAALFVAHRHDEVPGILARLEDEVERNGLHAAGFLAYEAGKAFDAAMPAASCAPFPLAWFGLYGPPAPAVLDASGDVPPLAWSSELNEASHAAALVRIRDHLAGGETYQVNFTHRLRTLFAGNPWALSAGWPPASPRRTAPTWTRAASPCAAPPRRCSSGGTARRWSPGP